MAERSGNAYKIDVRARATINGADVPVASVQLDFPLDGMPVATLFLSLGRNVYGNKIGQVSEAEGLITQLQPFAPVNIFVTATPVAGRAAPPGKSAGFPAGSEFQVFEGFLLMPSTNKSRLNSNATLTVTAYGRPMAYAGTTQFITGTHIEGIGGGDQTIVQKFGAKYNGRRILYDELLSVSPSPSSSVPAAIRNLMQIFIANTTTWAQTNSFAQDALSKLQLEGSFDLSRYATSGEFQEALDRRLSVQLIDLFYFTWVERHSDGSTGDLWDALTRAIDMFMFRFVPCIDRDIIAPITMCLGGEPFKTIDPNEYWAIDISKKFSPKDYSYVSQLALKSDLFQPHSWQSIATYPAVGFAEIKGIAGGRRGRLKVVEAPDWLLPPDPNGRRSLNPGGELPDFVNPDIGSETGELPEKIWFNALMGNAAADALLRDLVFAHRRAVLTGRMRFDIAPGSLLRINTVGEQFTGLKDTVYGHVLNVHVDIGESTGAQTSFEIGSIRSQAEQDSIGVPLHPLYASSFIGAPLTEEAG